MFGQKRVSVVIPCHNEELGIAQLLERKPPFIDEVIVVDNHSTDQTAEVSKKYGAKVVYEPRLGYGQAYLAGFPRTTGEIIVIMDGDNSYPLEELEKILLYMQNGNYDLVNACRYPLVYKNAQPRINEASNYFISWLIRAIFRIRLNDSQSGMTVFKKEILEKIKPLALDFSFSQEFKIRAFRNHQIKCGEIHITYSPRIGQVKLKKIDGIKNLLSVFSLWKRINR